MRTNLNPSESINFSDFYQKYRNVILVYITRRIPHTYEAEDLTQDVFIRLWEHWAFVNPNTIWSLLYTIARNMITDRIRRQYRQEDFLSSFYYNEMKETGRNSVEEEVQYHELEQIHEMAICTLSAKRRQIYKLSFNEELSCPAIAGQMSLSPRTVEGQLLIARKKVRAYLQEEFSKVG